MITRSDFDGLVCAILLKELGRLGDLRFVHPKDFQDGKIEVNENDILTNLPCVPGCFLCFDHDSSEKLRNSGIQDDRYVLQADSARFECEDVLNPTGWGLMSFLMDARTGLGRFRTFRVSNYQLMMDRIDYRKGHTIDEILTLPDVKERLNITWNIPT